MERQSVDSSEIISVGYDKPSKILEIEFHGNRIYRYKDVPEEVYNELIDLGEFTDGFFVEDIQYSCKYSRIK